MKNKNKIFVVITLFSFIGLAYGYYLFNKPVESIKNKKPHYSLDAFELLNAFEQDEVAANSRFLDKIIQVTGTIIKIDIDNNIHIGTGNPLSSLIFEMDDRDNTSTLKVGDEVTIKGLCTGYLMDVVMVGSVVMK